jgi:hypothetical protein
VKFVSTCTVALVTKLSLKGRIPCKARLPSELLVVFADMYSVGVSTHTVHHAQ